MILYLMAAAASTTPADAWTTCLTTRVETLVRGTATADTIADQAMRACAADELAVRRSIEKDAGGASVAEVSQLLDTLSRDTRKEMRTLAIELRALQPKAAAPRPAATAAAPLDPRAAARAKAAAVQKGSTATGPLTLKLKVFNSATVPVGSMNTIATNGSVGANWLTQKAIAPSAFHTFTFTNAACSRNLRATFSSGASLTRMLDFCGKTTLYISNRDMWVE
ncbi:hypothetical protein OSJ57_25550 [Sphingomonas sp. HH69]